MDNELYARFEMPQSQIHVRQLLGQGAFGQVHEAVAHGLVKGEANTPTKVAVKSLRGNCHYVSLG